MATPECYNSEVFCGGQCVSENRCCLPEFGWLCPEGLACFTIGAVVDCYDTTVAIPTTIEKSYSYIPAGECTDSGSYEYCSDPGVSSYYSTELFIPTVIESSLTGVSEIPVPPSTGYHLLSSIRYPLLTSSSEVPSSNPFETFLTASSGTSLSVLPWIPLITQSELPLPVLSGTPPVTTTTLSFLTLSEQPHLTPSPSFSTYSTSILTSGEPPLSTLSESPLTRSESSLSPYQPSPTTPSTLSLPAPSKRVSSYIEPSHPEPSLTTSLRNSTLSSTFLQISPESPPSAITSTPSSANPLQTPTATSAPPQTFGPSKGVIAGVVLGVICAAAIFAVLGFMLGRRKQIKKQSVMVTVPFEAAQYRERPIFSYVPIREEDHNPNFSNQPEQQPLFQPGHPGGYPDQHYYN